MTIEATLERIAAATEATAASLATLVVRTGGGAPGGEPPPETAKRPGRPPKQKPEPPPPQAPTLPVAPAEPVESVSDFLDDAEPPPTRDDVRAWLVKLGKAHQNPEKGRPILKEFGGADTVGSLPEAKFAAVIEACKKAMPAAA